MKTNFFRTLSILILCLTLVACNLPGSNNASQLINQQTSVAQTVAVLETQLSVNSTPVVPMIATNTPEALMSETPALTATATIQPFTPTVTQTPAPTYRIGSVQDITYPDDVVVKPNETFVKTWRITNGGTGTWNSNFRIVFVSGDAMGAPASKTINATVGPGGSVDVSVELKAPAVAKTYQGKWMMQTDNGVSFGLGPNADGTFWVKVKVDIAFAVTGAVPVVAPATYTGVCPVTLAISANITATTSGTITYYFVTSLGNSPTYELKFDAAGTKTTAVYSLPVPSTTALSVSVYNDHPNHQEFPAVVIPINCTP